MKDIVDNHLDKILALILVLAFAGSLLYVAQINPQDSGLIEALKGALQYALGIFSALMLPGGIGLLKGFLHPPADTPPTKQLLSQ